MLTYYLKNIFGSWNVVLSYLIKIMDNDEYNINIMNRLLSQIWRQSSILIWSY